MACDTRYAEADDYAILMCLDRPLCSEDEDTIEAYLDMAAGDLHVARASVDGCSCTLSTGASIFLKILNVRIAAVLNVCPCGRANLSDAMRGAWIQWATAQLDAIRTGKLELCEGETGSEYPFFTYAEQSLTVWAAEQIITNREMRLTP